MKTLFLILFVLASVPHTLAQKVLVWEPKEKNPANMPVDERGEVRFHEIVLLPNTASTTIIKRAYAWATNNYPLADNVIQHTKNRLVINGAKKIKMDALIGHKLVLEVKRGQYQVTVDSLHYIFNLTSSDKLPPVKFIRTMPIHSYGASADDFYELYKFVGSIIDPRTANGTNAKKMATTYANQQGLALTEVKQMIEDLLASLKKATENDAGQ